MTPGKIPYKNAEGYADPTAHAAMNAVQDEQEAADSRDQNDH